MSEGIHISLAAEPIAHIAGVPITNSLLAGVIGSIIVFTLFALAARKVAMNPKGKLSLIIDTISDMILGLIDSVTLNRQKSISFFPLLMTLFMFIVVNNWLGLLPGFGSITITTDEGTMPLLRGATADLNTTLAQPLFPWS